MPAIDIDELKEIMDNDSQLIQECFAEFLMDYPMLMAQIKTAVDAKDYDAIDASAHKLKGTLRYLAAEKAASAAQAVETAGRQQDLEGINQTMPTLEAACQKVIVYIDQFPL
jgi:HPt (histidine-containing phosphotransfer) domain-containing protein